MTLPVTVTIFLARTPTWPVTYEELRGWLERLPVEEQKRIGRYRHFEDQSRGLVAVLLARHAIAARNDCPVEGVRFQRASSGRPYVVEPSHDLGDFNVSHDGRWVGCATVPVGRVGFDIVKPAEFASSLMSTILSAPEEAMVRARPTVSERRRLLAELWAAKEAYVKMLGTGLTVDPTSIGFDMLAWERGDIHLHPNGLFNDAGCSFSLVDWSADALGVICSDCEIGPPSVHFVEWATLVNELAV